MHPQLWFINAGMINTAITALLCYCNETEFRANNRKEFTITDQYVHEEDVAVVWFSKTLQNYKVIMALPNHAYESGSFFEFTWDGDKNQGYLDVYTKGAQRILTADHGWEE